MWLTDLLLLSGLLALGGFGQLVASRREDAGKPSPSGAVAQLGARMCLGCWTVGLLLKIVDWTFVGLSDGVPLPLQTLFGISFYAAMAVSAAGIIIAAIGGAAWLIRD